MRTRRAGVLALAATFVLAGCQLIWPTTQSDDLQGQSPGPTSRPLVVTTPAPTPGEPSSTDGPPADPTPEIPPPID